MTTEHATITQGRKFSGIWFIPLLALVLGIYMVIHNWMTEGPEIDIAFTNASGLEEGKTKVKYRNVDMGTVTVVRLNDKFDGVVAQVKLDRQALPLLREDTRFWVVTAQVGLDNISGLDTLLSGAYVQLAPGSGKKGARKFTALEKPPLTPSDAPGLRLKLTADHASSVSAGDLILFNGYRVGRVESMEFDPTDKRVHYDIFINAPYHKLVNSNVHFWDVSGISLSADASGFKVVTGSLDTILLGGVAFGAPDGVKTGDTVAQNTEFTLYRSEEDSLKNPYRYGAHYVVSFSQSIKGLEIGAAVEYRGIILGRVERIMIKESLTNNIEKDTNGHNNSIPILIYLEPGRLQLPDTQSSLKSLQNSIRRGVTNGLRASMETGSLLTGAKYINIDYFEGIPTAEIGSFFEYPSIPTIETGLDQLEQKLNAILDKINSLPLEKMVSGANDAVVTLNKTLDSLNTIMENQSAQQLPEQLGETLQELRAALKGFSPSSEAYQSINSSLLRLNYTLGNMESLTRTLAEKPNAVLFPIKSTPDPIPEVKQQ